MSGSNGMSGTGPAEPVQKLDFSDREAWVLYGLGEAMKLAHETAWNAGWYRDPKTGQQISRNFGEVVALMHSELSEMLEAHRKNLLSQKVDGLTGIEEELADLFLRALDTAQHLNLRLGLAVVLKNRYNQSRIDHTLEARTGVNGKRY